jgi:hypothetical protein
MITLRTLLLIFAITISCKKQPPPQLPQPLYQREIIQPNDVKTITPIEAKTYHIDEKHKYEYRTGISGDYEYNYEVVGTDSNENKVEGNIIIDADKGAGIIIKNDEEIEIQVKWIGRGKLKGIDKNSNEYTLEVKID